MMEYLEEKRRIHMLKNNDSNLKLKSKKRGKGMGNINNQCEIEEIKIIECHKCNNCGIQDCCIFWNDLFWDLCI